jgi:hypothetical protein
VDGITVGELKTRLTSMGVSPAELYSRLATMEAEGRIRAARGDTVDETRLHLNGRPSGNRVPDDSVYVDDSVLRDLQTEMADREERESGVPTGGKTEGSDPASGTRAGNGVELERVLGAQRSEDSPFGPGLKPEEVNPNVQHLDPKLLQPMEMRVSKDRGANTRDTSSPVDADARAKALMEKAQKEREKMRGRRDRYGVEQEGRPTNGDHK